jgi:hypothetical protein
LCAVSTRDSTFQQHPLKPAYVIQEIDVRREVKRGIDLLREVLHKLRGVCRDAWIQLKATEQVNGAGGLWNIAAAEEILAGQDASRAPRTNPCTSLIAAGTRLLRSNQLLFDCATPIHETADSRAL